MRKFVAGLLAGTVLAAQGGAAWAQTETLPGTRTAEEAASEDAAKGDEDASAIVVTGTLIRGIAPGGSQTIAIQQEQITAVGAANTSQLLASVPQAGTFNVVPAVRGGSNFQLSVNRPSLRYLGNTSSGTNSTLVLVDGHRLPGMGVLQTTPDLDAIATGAIERVEIITDGGSSTYGSDAVGGVINFITRKRFDGVEARARYGFADNYHQFDAALTVGKAWDFGSIWASYDYVRHDSIYGRDRDFVRSLDWIQTAALGTPVGNNTQCEPGNITLNGVRYALPGLAAGLGNRCDIAQVGTIFPREERHSVFGGMTIDNGGPVVFTVKAFYTKRRNESDAGTLTASLAVPRLITAGNPNAGQVNPFYIPVGTPPSTATETFEVNFLRVLPNGVPQVTKLESYGFTPTMQVDLGGGWNLNAMVNYGHGESEFKGQLVNLTPIRNAINAGTFNPANLAAPGNAATLAAAFDQFNYGKSRQDLITARAVVDGSLFTLPGGDVKVALGGEYMREDYDGNTNAARTAAQIDAFELLSASRTVSSVFGEINVPIIGADNAGFIYALSLTGSGRYDRYSDFGGTFNPKLGINLEPFEGLKLRGNWGKSYQAPSLADIALATSDSLFLLGPPVPFPNPAVPVPTNGLNNVLVLLGGVISPLDPQKAKTYSFGFDFRPKPIAGLSLGMTYYHIDFTGQISIPPIFNPSVYYGQFPSQYVMYTAGPAAVQSFLNTLLPTVSNPQILNNLPNGINSIYAVGDDRKANLNRTLTDGLDFYLRYRRETGFGALFFDLNGTYILNFKTQASPGAAMFDITKNDTRLRTNTNIGADIGPFRAQLTWNYSQGFNVTPTAANLQQSKVKAFNLFNLFLQYKVPGDGALLSDLAFTVNVDNVFDTDPPLFRGTFNNLPGIANGFTIGRVIKVGVSKKF